MSFLGGIFVGMLIAGAAIFYLSRRSESPESTADVNSSTASDSRSESLPHGSRRNESSESLADVTPSMESDSRSESPPHSSEDDSTLDSDELSLSDFDVSTSRDGPSGGARSRSTSGDEGASSDGVSSSNSGAHEQPTTEDAEEYHWLVGWLGPLEGQAFHVGVEESIMLGRAPRCDIQVARGEISRVHCRFRPDGETLHLETIETVNGTRVDGDVVEGGASLELRDGVILEIGGGLALEYRRNADFETNDLDDLESEHGISTDMQTASVEESFNLEDRIERALDMTGGDLERSAELLDTDPDNLEYLLDQLDLE